MDISSLKYKIDRFKQEKLRILSKIYYKALHSPLRVFLLPKKCEDELKITPCKTWGPDLYIKSFNEYVIPGKNNVYKIQLENIASYLTDEKQSPRVLADLHSFNWINHVSIVANKSIRKIIKTQISFWINTFVIPNGIAWSPIVTAKRIFRWMNCYFVIKSSEKELLSQFLISLHRQAKYLYLIRNLYQDIEWISCVYKSLLLYAISASNEGIIIKISDELELLLKYTKLDVNKLSPLEMIKLLVALTDIKTLVSSDRKDLIAHLENMIQMLQNTIYTVNNEAGTAMFNSLYTPTRQFVSSVLSSANTPPVLSNERFLKASAFNSDLIIDQNDLFFAFDFHFANQIANTSNTAIIKLFQEDKRIEQKVCKVKCETEKGYFLFSGNSVFKYPTGNVAFSRRLYMNNLGTELRGEDVIASQLSASVINEFSISDGAKISKLAYQKGLNIEFLSGKKWLLLLSDNIDLTSTKYSGKIINGVETSVTIIRLEAYKDTEYDCVCKWSLREV